MVLNYIWIFFFGAAFIVALCKLIFMGDTEVFSAIVKATFDMSKTGFEISLGFNSVDGNHENWRAGRGCESDVMVD